MSVSVKDLSFSYSSKDIIIKNITFEVKDGEIFTILGPNGAGKTTLLKCINKLLKPKTGIVLIDNKPVSKMSIREIAKKVAYVPQKTETNSLTVFDTVLLGRIPYINFAVSNRDLKITTSIIEKLGLRTISLRSIDKISGGELQKTVIARALAQEAKVMLLDEPISGFDIKNQIEVLNFIKDVAKSHNITVIMTLHDINLALRYSDRILLMKNGVIYSILKPGEVTPELIEDVYEIKVNIYEFEQFHHVIPL